jgi:hypothetical protein
MLFGKLAAASGCHLPIIIMYSAAGFYLGTERFDDDLGMTVPYTRESNEYWPTKALAEESLARGKWSQKANL